MKGSPGSMTLRFIEVSPMVLERALRKRPSLGALQDGQKVSLETCDTGNPNVSNTYRCKRPFTSESA